MNHQAPNLIHPHVPTLEVKLAPILRQSPILNSLYKTVELNRSISSDVAVCGILPYLDRRRDFQTFSQVCSNWNTLAKIVRATIPACAKDVRVAIEFGLHGPNKSATNASEERKDKSEGTNTYDGEYTLFHQGLEPSMTLYCHNVLSDRPTEFISLVNDENTNYSYAPTAGSCRGTSVNTRFFKLRFDPWALIVKTDDYTFAETSGGPLKQTYWNGERTVTLDAVPYATARASNGGGWYEDTPRAIIDNPYIIGPDWPLLPEGEGGTAMIDLRGTCFYVENASGNGQNSAFCCMGCRPWGRISVKDTAGPNYQLIHLTGGGFAGRLVPRHDRTRDEKANSWNFDDEGNNGGWVLPLKIMNESNIKEGTNWTVTSAINVDCA